MEDIEVERIVALNENSPMLKMDRGYIRILSIGDTFCVKEDNYYRVYHILPNNSIQEINIHLKLKEHG